MQPYSYSSSFHFILWYLYTYISFSISYKYCFPNRRVKKQKINRYNITNKVALIKSFNETNKWKWDKGKLQLWLSVSISLFDSRLKALRGVATLASLLRLFESLAPRYENDFWSALVFRSGNFRSVPVVRSTRPLSFFYS